MKQNIINLFSNLAGSILGLLGTIGFVMSIIEGKYEDVKSKRNKRLYIHDIINRSETIHEINFGTSIAIDQEPSKFIECTHEINFGTSIAIDQEPSNFIECTDFSDTLFVQSINGAYLPERKVLVNPILAEDKRDSPIKISKVLPTL
jgi:hypothetical protein